MKIEIELPEIEGFEYTGEYRLPVRNDWAYCVETEQTFQFETIGSDTKWHILRKLKPKREFKDGAFYPVVRDLMDDRFIAKYRENYGFSLGGGRHLEEDFSWIGEELVIEWGEG